MELQRHRRDYYEYDNNSEDWGRGCGEDNPQLFVSSDLIGGVGVDVWHNKACVGKNKWPVGVWKLEA